MLKTYKYRVDFSAVKYFIEIHEVLKRDLDFPDYYSGTLDGLWDCLTDMLGGINYIEIHGFDLIEYISLLSSGYFFSIRSNPCISI